MCVLPGTCNFLSLRTDDKSRSVRVYLGNRMLRTVLFGLSLTALLPACSIGKASREGAGEVDDFSLDPEYTDPGVDDKSYFNDLQRSDAAVGFEPSFPLPFAVGKSIDLFDAVPMQAQAAQSSHLTIYLGECRFTLKTGPVQVDRYILAGQWVKLDEGLPAKVPVKLEPHMDLNLKLVTKLQIEIPSASMNVCKSLLTGRRVYIGRFHMNKSRLGLLAGPGYPRAVFSSRSMEPKGKRVFIRWQAGEVEPTLIDDFDFPATCESGIFRALMGERGYYYLVLQPALRMDQVDQLVIKIPFQPDSKPRVSPRIKRKKPGE